jgi:AcrR family transcriptional regulator
MGKATNTLRQRLRDATAEAMLDAAERAMIKKGYEKATMQEIAAEAGCAAGTFYLYFKNKEVLFEAIVAKHGTAMFAAAREAMAAAESPLEKIRCGVTAHLRYVHQHKGFFRLFLTAMPMRNRTLHSHLSPRIRQQRDDHHQMELEVFRAAQKKGQIRKDISAELLQEFMDAAGMGLVEQFLFGGGKQTIEEQIDIVWGLISGGIAGRSSHERS